LNQWNWKPLRCSSGVASSAAWSAALGNRIWKDEQPRSRVSFKAAWISAARSASFLAKRRGPGTGEKGTQHTSFG
jgi:hypothetical protein